MTTEAGGGGAAWLSSDLGYAYTPGGNVAGITDASYGEPFTLTFGYDGVNRLTTAQVHMPTGIETVQYVYLCDGVKGAEGVAVCFWWLAAADVAVRGVVVGAGCMFGEAEEGGTGLRKVKGCPAASGE